MLSVPSHVIRLLLFHLESPLGGCKTFSHTLEAQGRTLSGVLWPAFF